MEVFAILFPSNHKLTGIPEISFFNRLNWNCAQNLTKKHINKCSLVFKVLGDEQAEKNCNKSSMS